jgi:hypothetical protein
MPVLCLLSESLARESMIESGGLSNAGTTSFNTTSKKVQSMTIFPQSRRIPQKPKKQAVNEILRGKERNIFRTIAGIPHPAGVSFCVGQEEGNTRALLQLLEKLNQAELVKLHYLFRENFLSTFIWCCGHIWIVGREVAADELTAMKIIRI